MISPLTRTLCECTPCGISISATIFGCLGSLTSRIVVPCGGSIVADERVAVLDYDLPATRHIRASDLSYVLADTKLWRIAVLLAHEFVLPFGLSSFFYQAGCDAINSIIRLWGGRLIAERFPIPARSRVDRVVTDIHTEFSKSFGWHSMTSLEP